MKVRKGILGRNWEKHEADTVPNATEHQVSKEGAGRLWRNEKGLWRSSWNHACRMFRVGLKELTGSLRL